jgi:hypothetical protein
MINQHVVPHSEGWAVKREGGIKATSVFITKKEATKEAEKIAKNKKSELIVHNRTGRIMSRNSYAN